MIVELVRRLVLQAQSLLRLNRYLRKLRPPVPEGNGDFFYFGYLMETAPSRHHFSKTVQKTIMKKVKGPGIYALSIPGLYLSCGLLINNLTFYILCTKKIRYSKTIHNNLNQNLKQLDIQKVSQIFLYNYTNIQNIFRQSTMQRINFYFIHLKLSLDILTSEHISPHHKSKMRHAMHASFLVLDIL